MIVLVYLIVYIAKGSSCFHYVLHSPSQLNTCQTYFLRIYEHAHVTPVYVGRESKMA